MNTDNTREQIYEFIKLYVDTPEPKKLCSSIQDLVEGLAESKVKNLALPNVMPRSLTAENGAKALLSGEFFEEHECNYYDADGDLVEYTEKVTVSWTNIKEIYKKVVAHYGA